MSEPVIAEAQHITVSNNSKEKKIAFGNDKIKMVLDYNHKATISSVILNGQPVIEGEAGIYSSIKTQDADYSTLQLSLQPLVKVNKNMVTVYAITYGDHTLTINETWTFNITTSHIKFTIDRTLSKSIIAEQVAFPVFTFKNSDTWEGAYTDYGGLAWFYLFNKKQDTYGVHSKTTRFWNSRTGNGMIIAIDAPGKNIAADYSRTPDNELTYTVTMAQQEIVPRFDSGTYRRRFIRNRTDVWSPVNIDAGSASESITLSWFDYKKQFDRGNLVGINQEQVNGVLNTIARIGVIDKQHFGGNSWHTPYGPICLHEQYIAQMGLAINDPFYLQGYQECLDFYRDNAIRDDGRVWPRWAYSNEDAMPGIFTDKGFYEAQWGYLLDSNPDYVTNVAELYDQTGNIKWLKTHQRSCEKALDWILNRDSNSNGLVEMMTDSHTQKRGSDWIDIIWASYENAFVNAKLYHALVLWAAIENQLGNKLQAGHYSLFADKLKTNFNKSISAGGFWDDEKNCYIHWRDKDGSVHGDNMVTPVNFMAIAYGICDDETKQKKILDNIEMQMQHEQLFFWPICLYSYNAGEGNDWQFPFPNYENGDIFLSWGSVGVKAYAGYKPELAVKYVKNVLARYAKDGLAFQRYGRKEQDGLGDDILAGNSLAVVGLYQAIYGINPLYNRFYLNPKITPELAGTQVKYNYRGQQLLIDLAADHYTVSNGQFKITARNNFGYSSDANELLFFNGNKETPSLKIMTGANKKLAIEIISFGPDTFSWIQQSRNDTAENLIYRLNDLVPGISYTITVNDKIIKKLKSKQDGALVFDLKAGKDRDTIVVKAGK
jgi:hypothetical protein